MNNVIRFFVLAFFAVSSIISLSPAASALTTSFPAASVQNVSAANGVFDDVKTYKIFYDAPTPAIINKMKAYDLVIIEPLLYTKTQIETIKANGTKVFGYINSMEADNWNTAFLQKLQPADYYQQSSQKYYIQQWDSYLMNMSSPHFRQLLLSEIEAQVYSKNMDGVFFDTVGNIDDYFSGNPDELAKQRAGLEELLKSVKNTYPSLGIIQNWGMETLKTTSAKYVDAIMWENFNHNVVSKDAWSKNQMSDLKAIQKETGLKVLTVSFEQHSKSEWYSLQQGFLHYKATKDFNRW
ncbi:endo alpha-1,4 polygalactosaminidase [Metabacillus sp. KIGAM252]|uniref:Endo alpha-1,4 polygalactosaminidase n=1 Tax=Metabacillus flavus TaxID=2823519 RepID=A0ABS5LI39_9BACI|nr:putative glycoside hydrolase [Metabacillus flavus]MBS2970039.1 endo alpha-1,4 polygalactosaminidase [Metabacillus flavus]